MTRICITAIVVCLGCVIVGCKQSDKPGALPRGAYIYKDYGNGWIVFGLDDMLFLFYRDTVGYGGRCAITQIYYSKSQNELTWRWEKRDGSLEFVRGGR